MGARRISSPRSEKQSLYWIAVIRRSSRVSITSRSRVSADLRRRMTLRDSSRREFSSVSARVAQRATGLRAGKEVQSAGGRKSGFAPSSHSSVRDEHSGRRPAISSGRAEAISTLRPVATAVSLSGRPSSDSRRRRRPSLHPRRPRRKQVPQRRPSLQTLLGVASLQTTLRGPNLQTPLRAPNRPTSLRSRSHQTSRRGPSLHRSRRGPSRQG